MRAASATIVGHPAATAKRALTGDTATQGQAAAVATTGGTADRATTENDNSNAAAAYEVHVTKSDGSHPVVILNKSFAVLTVETGGHGFGPHAGHDR